MPREQSGVCAGIDTLLTPDRSGRTCIGTRQGCRRTRRRASETIATPSSTLATDQWRPPSSRFTRRVITNHPCRVDKTEHLHERRNRRDSRINGRVGQSARDSMEVRSITHSHRGSPPQRGRCDCNPVLENRSRLENDGRTWVIGYCSRDDLVDHNSRMSATTRNTHQHRNGQAPNGIVRDRQSRRGTFDTVESHSIPDRSVPSHWSQGGDRPGGPSRSRSRPLNS